MTNNEFKKALIDNGCIEATGFVTEITNVVDRKSSVDDMNVYAIKKGEVVAKIALNRRMAQELYDALGDFLNQRRYYRYTSYKNYNRDDEGEE